MHRGRACLRSASLLSALKASDIRRQFFSNRPGLPAMGTEVFFARSSFSAASHQHFVVRKWKIRAFRMVVDGIHSWFRRLQSRLPVVGYVVALAPALWFPPVATCW